MDARTEPNPSHAPIAASPPVSGMVDVDAILREVEALAHAAMDPALHSQSPEPQNHANHTPAPSHHEVDAGSTSDASFDAGTFDLGKLERELEALLNVSSGVRNEGNPSPVVVSDAASSADVKSSSSASSNTTAPSISTPTPSVATASINTDPIDPMLQEISAILDDTNDSILRSADGSVDGALNTVFDARALAGQEEDVSRALIEAFGTSRRPIGLSNIDGHQAAVTNPVPRFEGISRALPPDMAGLPPASSTVLGTESPTPTRRFEEIAAQSIGRESLPDYAGETPFEPAFPAVPISDAAPVETLEKSTASTETLQSAAQTVAATTVVPRAVEPSTMVDAAPKSSEQTSTQHAVGSSKTDSTSSNTTEVPSHKRFASTFATGVATQTVMVVKRIATMPFQVCALPMRCVPESFRGYITVTALSMLIWVPVSWWMAQRSVHTQGVGRVEFATAAEHGAEHGNERATSPQTNPGASEREGESEHGTTAVPTVHAVSGVTSGVPASPEKPETPSTEHH